MQSRLLSVTQCYDFRAIPRQPATDIADSVRLGLAFSRKVPCTQNMRF